MNYVISYWAPADMPSKRREWLCQYFDLQRYTKAQFGAEQIIVTNLDYPGAIPFVEPPGFKREYALFAMYFGLGQLLDQGLDCPVVIHDHDLFIKRPINPSEHIQCTSKTHQGRFSEQLLVFPEACRATLLDYIEHLKTFNFEKVERQNCGANVRHEGMYSSEYALAGLENDPFAEFKIDPTLILRDLVSFDIRHHHSLDSAYCTSEPIYPYVQAIHGHINKGPASDALFQWLAS